MREERVLEPAGSEAQPERWVFCANTRDGFSWRVEAKVKDGQWRVPEVRPGVYDTRDWAAI